MTFYIEKEGNIILHDGDRERLQNTIVVFKPELQGLDIQETDREIISHNEAFVFADTVLDELALQVKNDLIEKVNYPLKEKVAYTGVFFDYNGEDLCFETNKNSLALVNFTLTQILAGVVTEVKNWKCRRVVEPYEPVSVDFTVDQFKVLVAFAGVMVTQAFSVETEINRQIESLTAEQLNDKEFVEALKVQMAEAYEAVNTHIDLFPVEPEEEPAEPVEEPEVTEE